MNNLKIFSYFALCASLINFSIGCSSTRLAESTVDFKSTSKRLLSLDSSLVIADALILDVDTSSVEHAHKESFVTLKDVVAELFDPASHPCPLPSNVAKKLISKMKKKEPWIPIYIDSYLKGLPPTARLVKGTSITGVLHTVTLKRADGSTYERLLKDSPTYKNLNINDYINTIAYGNFAYSLDCSGYINAAIVASGIAPSGDFKATAKSALDKKSSMFIAGGTLSSPIIGAIYPSGLDTEMDKDTRLSILKSILLIPDLSDSDLLITPELIEVIWASKQGGSNFNGEADFSARGGIGMGVAQVSGSLGAGGTVSRTGSFSSFDTYVTDTKKSELKPITIKQIRDLTSSLSGK
ncbi:hypothetical protein AY601_4896 [Pedobacter cryoconitis]|uniref:Uncharacterized protein n=1 Tax=Pedobacter cryoconitis TaxID=188932 RepID=A0A127VK56_9SPHI|nr:hypothetical protein [Pedobacter cryoconitis]AMQ01716.1 hypothetical protein AY601_4896 [Pedobacter cryoconitis]